MNHTWKILLSACISVLTYFVAINDNQQIYYAAAFALITLTISLAIIYGKGKIVSAKDNGMFFFSIAGSLVGIGIAFFITRLLTFPGYLGISSVLYTIMGLLGLIAGSEYSKIHGTARAFAAIDEPTGKIDKILDTSVIIDGRILDIADTHFIDGPLILPNFVIREIQLISDSSDPIKRARGRRGLELLNKLQKKGSIEVKITYTDYADIREVDHKLIKLARDTGGKIVTNDFNLNKVAELQGVEVMNLNNLANALKPVVLPGEELAIQVIKEGKDENQGIGYLEDGTMVVIENGGHLVGKDVRVNVTSIIQTAAGKMIFTKVNR